jgi:hypothetical protein
MNKIWPECVNGFRVFEEVPKIENDVASIAYEVGFTTLSLMM